MSTLVITNAHVAPVVGPEIPNGHLVAVDGVITAVGAGTAPSIADASIVDGTGCLLTPGLIVATHDLLARVPLPSDDEIREALAGNLCRCTGYEKILDAVRLAAARA